MRRTLLFGLTTAVLGVVGASASYAAPAPAVPLRAPLDTPVERKCGGTTKFEGTHGAKANVNSCVQTNGQFMTVSAPADCFLPAVVGYTQQKICSSYGTWKMYRDGAEVATGKIDTEVPYVGPGTYKVISKVTTRGHGDSPGNSTQAGTTEKTFTLTTARIQLPFSAVVAPDHLAPGQDTDLIFTVTRARGNDNNRSQIYLDSPIATSADPRCKRAVVGFGGPTFTACSLNLGPGESTQIKVAVKRRGHGCDPVNWRVTWGSGSLPGIVPCPQPAS